MGIKDSRMTLKLKVVEGIDCGICGFLYVDYANVWFYQLDRKKHIIKDLKGVDVSQN